MGGYNWSCLSNNTWYAATKSGTWHGSKCVTCPPWLINPQLICFTKRCGSTWQTFFCHRNWTTDCLYACGVAYLFPLKNFIKFIPVTSSFSLCTRASKQIFSPDLKNSLKYSIHNISINLPFLNTVDWSGARQHFQITPNPKPSFCIHNHSGPIIFLLVKIKPLVN